MIITKLKTEASYRAIQMESSSSLKEFSMDKRKYYKKYILNERVEEADNKAATTGRVVETLLLEPQEFDGRFYMSTCMSAPTGLMLAFVEALYKYTAESTNSEGEITRDFDDICKDAYTESGFKIKYDAVLAKFIGSDAEIFYKELREVKSKGLTVVTAQDVTNAEKIVEELKTNQITADVVNLVNSARYTIHNQFQIEGYSVDSRLFKSMLDKIVVDHSEKKIWIYDLKCTWSVENFHEEYYLYRRAYIQAYLYFHAVKSLTINSQSELSGYDVQYPRFIVCDSTNYFSPLIYTTDQSDMLNAYHGFEHKGRKYPGVKQIIEDLKWAVDNDKWNISRENYLNNGLVNIKSNGN